MCSIVSLAGRALARCESVGATARVSAHRNQILSSRKDKEQEFLQFVLDQYVKVGVSELDEAKLPNLVTLKYTPPMMHTLYSVR
jgi:hypothetical protein